MAADESAALDDRMRGRVTPPRRFAPTLPLKGRVSA